MTDTNNLTEEERAALAEFGADDDELEATVDAEAEADDAAAPAAPAAEDVEDDAPKVDDEAAPIRAPLDFQEPDKADERLADIAARKKAVRESFDAGDITTEELHAKTEGLDDERAAIRDELILYKASENARKTAKANAWEDAKAEFFTDGEGAKIADNRTQLAALDSIVRDLQEEKKAIGDKALLTEAWKRYEASLESLTGKKAEAVTPPAKPLPKPTAPRTLAKMPVAGTENVGDRQDFSAIDRQSTAVAKEKAYGRLSKEQQEAFLSGA